VINHADILEGKNKNFRIYHNKMISNSFRPKNEIRIILMSTIGLLWFGAISLRAADRYVVEPGTPGGTDTGEFSDWTIAATQIQWAVDKALTAGDTVWVSNGVYVLTNQIVLTNNIRLRSSNGPDVTIVNGGFGAGAPGTTTNRCLYMSNAAAFVSGFTFSNGAATNKPGGGGVWMYGGTLSNCTVRDNICFTSGDPSGGGGIFARLMPGGLGGCTITACRVTGNIVTNSSNIGSGAGFGGGVYVYGLQCEVYDCLVSNNHVVGYTGNKGGGGIYAYNGARVRSSMICYNSIYSNTTINGSGGGVYLHEGDATMNSCTVTVNQAQTGGGASLKKGMVTNCLISNNYGRDQTIGAGGIYLSSHAPNYVCYAYNTTIIGNTNAGVGISSETGGGTNHMVNCTIENNTLYGVNIYGSQTSTVGIVSNCTIRGNGAGGIRCGNLKNVQIRNCLIANNTNAGDYVGLLIGSGCRTGLVSSCTIVSNVSTNYGAGLRFETTNGSDVSVSSCIIYSNGIGGTNDVFDACAPTNYNALKYSCIGTNPGFTGAGIIVADPHFKNFSGGNFRLAGNSPCVNRGFNESWMTNTVDLDRRTRVRYGTVDMGAYETIQDGTVYGFH